MPLPAQDESSRLPDAQPPSAAGSTGTSDRDKRDETAGAPPPPQTTVDAPAPSRTADAPRAPARPTADGTAADSPEQPVSGEKKNWFVAAVLLVITAVLITASAPFAISGIQRLEQDPDFSWTSRNMVAVYLTIAVAVLFLVAFATRRHFKKNSNPKNLVYWLCAALLGLTAFWTWRGISTMQEAGDFSWGGPRSIALYFTSGVFCFGILAFIGLMRRATTRWDAEERLSADKDISDWLVIFSWTKKVLHLPTIVCAFLAAFAVWLHPEWGRIVGAAWFCVWLFCHTIEDNNISLAVATALLAGVLLFTILAVFGGVLDEVFGVVKLVSMTASPALYIGFALAYLMSIALSYVKGLFYYVAIEPNQMIVQSEIGEDGETFQRMQYEARVEASVDIIGWFFYDMATIKIQFRDGKRSPMDFYVGRIKKKAAWLSAVLGVTAIDRAERVRR